MNYYKFLISYYKQIIFDELLCFYNRLIKGNCINCQHIIEDVDNESRSYWYTCEKNKRIKL